MKQNQLKRLCIGTGILFIIAVAIKIASLFSGWIEINYSTGFYPPFAAFLRIVFGWIPFSIGDIFYACIFIWLLIKFIKVIAAVFKRKVSRQSFLQSFIKIIKFILWIYIVFNLFWGLNYNRRGIAYQLQLQPNEYSTEELKTLTDSLVIKVNASRAQLGGADVQYPSYNKIFEEAQANYYLAKEKFTFINYQQKSVKASLYGKAGNYLGFLGYYNPFTGEAQVNIAVPYFLLPYTTCHEMAHQLGYATEDEANFVGYLAAKSSVNPAFHYSVYFDLFNYANTELFFRDSSAARANYHLLDTLVRKDERTYREFWLAYKNPAEPFINALYGKYLKENNQPKGMDTYSDVIAWLIAYQKKYKDL